MTNHRSGVQRSGEGAWRAVVATLLAASLLVPLIVGYDFFFPYVVPRNIFFRIVVELAATVLVLFVCLEKKRLVLRDEPIFWTLVGFVAAACLSALFSPAGSHSFFGDFERMGGVWAWLHLVLFFLLLRTLGEEEWRRVLNVALAVSMLVSAIAIAEHSHIAPLGRLVARVVPGSSSTVGNSGLLAAYLLFGVALSFYLAVTATRFKRLYLVSGAVNLTATILASNRSTVIGLVLGGIVGSIVFATAARSSPRRALVPSIALGLAAGVAAISAIIRAFPRNAFVLDLPAVLQRLALTNPAGADASRTIQWRTALSGFLDRPLLGYGLDNHNLAWSAHFDPRIYGMGTDVFDRTHNQFLELLATTGLIGTLAFLSVWVAIGISLYHAYRAQRLSATAVSILAGLQIAYATYLFFWFVDLNSTMLWILFAALIATRANPVTMIRPVGLRERERPALPLTIGFASVVLLVGALYFSAYAPLEASRALARINAPRGSVANTLAAFDVVTSSHAPQTAHTPLVLEEFLVTLKPRFSEMRENPVERRTLDRAFAQSLSAFKAEIHRDTLDDRLYTHEASLLMDAASFYGSEAYLEEAINALEHAVRLSPRRIQQRLLLATAYLVEDDTARARAALIDAVKTDPQLGEPRYRLAAVYLRTGQNDSALASLSRSLALGYVGSPDTYLAMGKRLEFSGRSGQAAALYADYLEAKYTEAVWEPRGSIDRSVPATDIAVAAHLPLLYARAQESELAIKTAAALALFDPSQSGVVDRFVSDVGARRRRSWLAKSSLLSCAGARVSVPADSLVVGACAVFRRKL